VNPEEHSPHPSSPPELVQAFQKLFSRYDPSTVKATEQRRHGAGSGSTAGSSAGSAKDSGSGFVEAAKEGGSTSSARPTGSVSYSEFWKAPQKLWKGVEMTEKEMETVMVSVVPLSRNHSVAL
jgi:ribosomal protein L15